MSGYHGDPEHREAMNGIKKQENREGKMTESDNLITTVFILAWIFIFGLVLETQLIRTRIDETEQRIKEKIIDIYNEQLWWTEILRLQVNNPIKKWHR